MSLSAVTAKVNRFIQPTYVYCHCYIVSINNKQSAQPTSSADDLTQNRTSSHVEFPHVCTFGNSVQRSVYIWNALYYVA